MKFPLTRINLGLGLSLLVLLIAFTVDAREFDKNWLKDRFDEMDNAINKGEGYSRSTNENGVLAWAESYLLDAYLDMYEATGDARYLEKFATQVKRVAENTDRSLGIRDYKGLLRTGWGSTKYSKKEERIVHLVQTGMILHPMVRFSLMVKGDSRHEQYLDLSSKLISLAQEAVMEFNSQWYFEDSGEASYWFSGNEPMEADLAAQMPINGPLALGRVIIQLHRLTGKEEYLNKSRSMALLFKKNLLSNGKDGYTWGYRLDLNKYLKVEDLSHGAIDVSFAIEAFKSGILFSRQDLEKFANTLLAARSRRKFSIYVNGSSDAKDPLQYSDASGRWLDLSEYNCALYDKVYEYFRMRIKGSRKEHPQILLGIAKLTKYYDKCSGKNRWTK